nr:protein YgfX [Ferrigenium kumadai]
MAILLLLFHLLVAGVVFLTALPVPPKLATFLLIVLSLVYYLARDALQLLPDSWREISLASGEVSATLHTRLTGQISGDTVVSPYFVVLGICLEGRRLPVFRVVFPDAVGRDRFRELCVRLRFA